MSLANLHFADLAEYHTFLGLAAPEHPLFSVASVTSTLDSELPGCAGHDVALSSDFYSISLKHIIAGEIFYGRTQYDCKNGTLIFTSPNQEVRVKRLKVESTGRMILLHEDFIRGHPLKREIKQYHYFSYAVNEALHLSPKEAQLMSQLFDQIEQEYHNNVDEFSQGLVLSQLDTLLKYANRFYHRQFLHRQERHSDLQQRFFAAIQHAINQCDRAERKLPSVESIAQQFAMTPRYLSDALKVETGKTAIENLHLHMIDQAKDRLLEPKASVATVAYELGFEYPQYFARLFKKKVGLTPTEYRKQAH